MAKPCSADLRARVVASVEAGRSCRQTARLLGVRIASFTWRSQRKRVTGIVAAKAVGSCRPLQRFRGL